MEPFTLILEFDAWTVRERDHWGQSAALRAKGEERVCGGTCFRRSQRVETASDRAATAGRPGSDTAARRPYQKRSAR